MQDTKQVFFPYDQRTQLNLGAQAINYLYQSNYETIPFTPYLSLPLAHPSSLRLQLMY